MELNKCTATHTRSRLKSCLILNFFIGQIILRGNAKGPGVPTQYKEEEKEKREKRTKVFEQQDTQARIYSQHGGGNFPRKSFSIL